MSVLGLTIKKIANYIGYFALCVGLIACAGSSGIGGVGAGPGNNFAAGPLDQAGSGGFQGNVPSTQVTQDGVIMPSSGQVYVRAERYVRPTSNIDVGTVNTAVSLKMGDEESSAPPPADSGKLFSPEILDGGVFQEVEAVPPIYLMIQLTSNDIRNEILDSFVFKDFESEAYQESFFDKAGHRGMLIDAPTYKAQNGHVVCGGNLTVWACTIIDGKYYASPSLYLRCPYGTSDNPFGTNPGDPSTVLTMREQPMQACPNLPQQPVNQGEIMQ